MIYVGVMLILPLIYFLLYGRYGFSDTDHGFIQGLSWRVLNGETPYWNFIYVRPPLSPYLHAVEMAILPEGIEMIGSRFFFYIEIWIIVLFGGLSLRYFFNFYRFGMNFWMFLSMAFIFTAHNFPPMPWHTVDALMFSSVGAYLVARGPSLWKVALGIVMLMLAAMCKQPFLVVPFVGIVAAYSLWGRKQGLIALLIVVVPLLVFSIAALISPSKEFIFTFWDQNAGVTSLRDLIHTGFLRYLKAFAAVFGFLIIGGFFWNRFHDKVQAVIGGVIGWLFIVGMVWTHAILTLSWQQSVPPLFVYTHMMWCITFVMAAAGILGKVRGAWPLMILLAASWASSISWGYPSPALAGVTLLFGFIWFIREYFEFEPPKYYYFTMLLLMFSAMFIMNRYPYRDEPRKSDHYHLGDIYPQLNFVYGGEPIYRKMAEMHQLVGEYKQPFTVLPSMPLAHYLEKQIPPIQVDWAHNAEMNWDKSQNELINKLEFTAPIVFIEKDKAKELDDPGKYGSGLARYVREHWQQVRETAYFWIYQKN